MIGEFLEEGESVENYYKSYEDYMDSVGVVLEYDIQDSFVTEKLTIDTSKVTHEDIEQIWYNFFIYNKDGVLSYTEQKRI